jgi:hypothetical protein
MRKRWEPGIGEWNKGRGTKIVDIPCAMESVSWPAPAITERKRGKGERMVVPCQGDAYWRGVGQEHHSVSYLSRSIS